MVGGTVVAQRSQSSEVTNRSKAKALAIPAVLLATILVMPSRGGAIVGGQPDGDLHPEVGAILVDRGPDIGLAPLCTGTLIDPKVFLTAAHCITQQPYQVTFDPIPSSTSSVFSGTFKPHPNFRLESLGSAYDIAVIILDKEVDATPARLPTAGLLDGMKRAGQLTQATKFTAVGYGFHEYDTGAGGMQVTTDRSRRNAVSTFDALARSYIHLSQNSATGDGGTCHGDSGGPNYLGAGAGETDVIAGITVNGDAYCKATNVPLRLDTETSREFLAQFVTLP